MRSETGKGLDALRCASAGDYASLLQLTGTNDPVDGAISLLGYKSDISEEHESNNIFSSTEPGDYTEGAVVRAAAAKLLGDISDERAKVPLNDALHDPGDADGTNAARSRFYYTAEGLVKGAAEAALGKLQARLGIA